MRPGGCVLVAATLLSSALCATLPGCASGKKSAGKGDADRYLRLAYVQRERGETQQAIDSAKQALVRDPKSADAHHFLGVMYLSVSQPKEAAAELRAAVRINPYLTDAHNSLGVAYRELKDYDKALKEFQTALNDRNYKTPEMVQLNLGNIYMDQGVLSEAIRCFQRSVDANPSYAFGYLSLGTAYQKSGKPDLAAEQFRKVMSLAPESPEAARAKQLLEAGGKRSGP